jgi:hypothetical protein
MVSATTKRPYRSGFIGGFIGGFVGGFIGDGPD